MKTKNLKSDGFTLLELLIVIAIIAILSVILILVLDPAEALKKSRDSQRMSDLATMKTALGLYSTATTTPIMAGSTNTGCKGSTANDAAYTAGDKIYYSIGSDTKAVTNGTLIDGVATASLAPVQVTSANLGKVDGTGWLPVNLSVLAGGSPISNMPIDPINTVTTGTAPASTDLVYRYVCSEKTLRYEIDAVLESAAFKTDDAKMAKDGGNNINYYEVGTDLTLLGTGTDF
jgi:prepilin-type N-terminal cleavage/methylation domain-containing protein